MLFTAEVIELLYFSSLLCVYLICYFINVMNLML